MCQDAQGSAAPLSARPPHDWFEVLRFGAETKLFRDTITPRFRVSDSMVSAGHTRPRHRQRPTPRQHRPTTLPRVSNISRGTASTAGASRKERSLRDQPWLPMVR